MTTLTATPTVALMSAIPSLSSPTFSPHRLSLSSPPSPPSVTTTTTTRSRRLIGSIRCEVALNLDSESSTDELSSKLDKVGSKVRLKAPLKLYHVPKLPDFELPAGTEGVIKQYVGFWKGKRISANLPFKVEFLFDVEGRGPVKIFAHLREDEFDFI